MKFLSAFLRSFMIQGSWNYDRLQGVGWSVAIEPLLRKLPGGKHGSSYRYALGRATQYFNSHPFFATLAIGAVARAEYKGLSSERIERFRSAIKGSLGAVGDRFIWAGVMPVASTLGVLATVDISPLVGIITFLVAFNAVHFTIRAWGLRTGWTKGPAVANALYHPVLRGSVRIGGFAAPFALGIATPVVVEALFTGFALGARIAAVMAAAGMFICLRWLLPTFGAARLGALAIAIALLIGALWR
jgi:mannose/fructose/N-acetylgalactosamine-specific phosphotransferase system component IID